MAGACVLTSKPEVSELPRGKMPELNFLELPIPIARCEEIQAVSVRIHFADLREKAVD